MAPVTYRHALRAKRNIFERSIAVGHHRCANVHARCASLFSNSNFNVYLEYQNANMVRQHMTSLQSGLAHHNTKWNANDRHGRPRLVGVCIIQPASHKTLLCNILSWSPPIADDHRLGTLTKSNIRRDTVHARMHTTPLLRFLTNGLLDVLGLPSTKGTPVVFVAQ